VDGNGQTLYYAREDSTIIGLNRAESSKISFLFKDDKIHRISFLDAPEGILKPLTDITDEEKKLSGFDWKVYLRPISKYDIYNSRKKKPEEKAEHDVTKIVDNGS